MIAASGLLATLVSLVPILEALGCGFDGLPHLARGRVFMSPEPDVRFREVTVQLTPMRRIRGLRHSRLMNDGASIDIIAAECVRALKNLDGSDGGKA